MGCSVIWALIDLYWTGGIGRLVFADRSAILADTPLLTPQEKAKAGAIFPPEALFASIERLTGGDQTTATAAFIRGLFSPGVPAEMLDAVVALNIMLPRGHVGETSISTGSSIKVTSVHPHAPRRRGLRVSPQ